MFFFIFLWLQEILYLQTFIDKIDPVYVLVQHIINHSDDESQSISENESGNDIQSIISPTQYEKD